MNSLFPVWLKKLKRTEQQVADIANKSSITVNHVFADNTARDAYFVINPTELVEGLFIKVGTGYQQYLNETWEDSSPVLVETLDDASLIDYDNTNSGLTATNVQAAIDENTASLADYAPQATTYTKTENDTALALKANKVQEAWTTPTLLNSWVQQGANVVQFYKNQMGEVLVKGVITNGTIGQPVFVFPAGYRPATSIGFATTANSVFGRVTVDTSGNVYVGSGSSNQTVYLDVIRFKAV